MINYLGSFFLKGIQDYGLIPAAATTPFIGCVPTRGAIDTVR